MAYIAAVDFREATLKEYSQGLVIKTTEAVDALITASISRLSRRFDDYTGDHFEPDDGTTLVLNVTRESRRLYLPERTRAVTGVETIAKDGTATVEVSGDYRLASSLDSTGTKESGDTDYDYLEIHRGNYLAGGSYWPLGLGTVEVTGNFGWAATPPDVKRAVALMVYDAMKPSEDKLRRAARMSSVDTVIDYARTQPTGIPEADEIIAAYTRNLVVVG